MDYAGCDTCLPTTKRVLFAETQPDVVIRMATAETNLDMQALIASVESSRGRKFLCLRETMRWCLANGLRVVQPMTLMSAGLYNDPSGAWLPSVLF